MRGDRLCMFVKCAHIPEGRAKKKDIGLGCPGPSSPLLVTDGHCPALHLTWCTNGLVPLEVVPESTRQKEVITGSKTLLRGSRTWVQ